MVLMTVCCQSLAQQKGTKVAIPCWSRRLPSVVVSSSLLACWLVWSGRVVVCHMCSIVLVDYTVFAWYLCMVWLLSVVLVESYSFCLWHHHLVLSCCMLSVIVSC